MKTKTIQLIMFSLFAAMLFSGCTTTDNGTLPQPSANFTPKETYAVSYDKLWDGTLNALDKSRITVISSDKASGIIQTDYIGGPGRLIMGGLGGAQSTRYKYNITARNQSDGSVRLNVVCKVESSINSGHGSSQWRDVSTENAALTKNLETWLYEQIEKGMQ